ncbi:DNA repair and recombination protein rhm52 [Purpureocillium lavendulum]|uniref:Tethering factor for nuclear proteasome STS1 n=1 Tax=Purpureocillium lavendulum TaxID=1247861 RepID=A0AB34FXW3_9HYPO|nr:DNA repair and recombination protein rhm52 [Purpureocillium lavendulum]
MANRKRKADEDGDETMSPMSSPAVASRTLARPSKKARANELIGRPLPLPRLLETLDTDQLRMVLERICERHPNIGQEVVSEAPRVTAGAALGVLREYQDKLKAAIPYGESSPEYTYYRIRDALVALLEALSAFTPQFLPPTEIQVAKSLLFLDGATKLVHELPNWEAQAYRHHKDNAYEELSRAWALVINEAGKRGGGITLNSGGWDQRLARHNEESGGRLATAVSAMGDNVGWMATNQTANTSGEQNSILNQLMSGTYGSPVRVGPCPGDQHTSWANPFEDARPRISEWTAKQIATISSKLDKQLGPEYISSRAGPGGSRVHYLTAEKCIGLANEVFGFNGWSSSIQNIQVDFADENPQTQRVSIGLSVIVRITLRDGTYHEDIGYGSIENAKGKAMAFEKAKKEGTTDGLKRALRSFGNVLGNCIYDQDYVKQVTKVKAQPVKRFDQDNLHRHADFVKRDLVKPEPAAATSVAPAAAAAPKTEPNESFEDYLGEMDEVDFCVPGDGHPDEVVIPNPVAAPTADKPPPQMQPPRQFSRAASAGNSAVRPPPPQTPNAAQSRPLHNQESNQGRPTAGDGRDSPRIATQQPVNPNPSEPVAFFSARSVSANAAELNAQQLQNRQLFNPKAESPSIRKTPGIDHTSSRPVARNGQHVAPASSQPSSSTSSAAVAAPAAGNTSSFTPVRQSAAASGPVTRSNVINPSLDHARRIGAPGAPGSPLANRSSYKPPSMKRPLPGDGAGPGAPRSPLVDVPTNTSGQVTAPAADGADAKRPRMA